MHTAILKQVITELTREGCFVERLAHDPAIVTFRSPDGSRLALAADDRAFKLAQVLEGPRRYGTVSRHDTLREAIRAAVVA